MNSSEIYDLLEEYSQVDFIRICSSQGTKERQSAEERLFPLKERILKITPPELMMYHRDIQQRIFARGIAQNQKGRGERDLELARNPHRAYDFLEELNKKMCFGE